MISRLRIQRTARLLLAVLVMEMVSPLIHADEVPISAVENVRFEIVEGVVFIYYDLVAPVDPVHAVSVYLRRESDSLFVYNPVNVRGDLGSVVIPGQRKRIIWELMSDFPEGLAGDDYYFVVEAAPVIKEEMSPFIWIGGGAAVVGGVLALILSGGDKPTPPTANEFPVPPGRP